MADLNPYSERMTMIGEAFGIDPYKFAKTRYSETHANIMMNKLGLAEMQALKILGTCKHSIDNRTFLEFAKSLISNWILEDLVAEVIMPQMFSKITKDGNDKNRDFLNNGQISSDSDFKVVVNGEERYVEMISNYSDYWFRQGKIDLRDAKAKKLLKQNALILAVDVKNGNVAIIDLKDYDLVSTYIPQWNKGGTQITIDYDKIFQEWEVSKNDTK